MALELASIDRRGLETAVMAKDKGRKQEMAMAGKSLGQIAYEAYCVTTGYKSLVSGAKLPDFTKLKNDIQQAWEAAGHAVALQVSRDDTGSLPA